MNRNSFWKFLFVVLVVVWALYELYPPTGRSLVQHFRERAVARDAAYTNILERVAALQKELPDR